MPIDIEKLKEDRESGAEGPWGVKYNNIHALGRCIARMDWAIHDSVDDANARRISRLPELEAAYIEAVECIISMVDAANSFQDEEGYQVASQVRIRANEFL